MFDVNSIIEQAGNHRRSLGIAERNGFALPSPNYRKPAFGFLESARSNNHLAESKLLDQVSAKVKTYERNCKRIRESDLAGSEKRNAIKAETQSLISSVEAIKTKKIDSLFTKIGNLEERYKTQIQTEDATRQLLRLEKAKLRYGKITEEKASFLIEKFSERGYDEMNLAVVASTSDELQKRADALTNALPPALANADGLSILGELKNLLDLPIGTVRYGIKNPKTGDVVSDKTHVLSLVSDEATRAGIDSLGLEPLKDSA